MKGLVITTENEMQVREFGEPAYETIGKAVGGWIEVVHPKGLPDPFCMVVNEEGLLHGLPLNLFGCILYDTVRHGNPIVGNIVILKEGFPRLARETLSGWTRTTSNSSAQWPSV